jgi:hypothetical protein
VLVADVTTDAAAKTVEAALAQVAGATVVPAAASGEAGYATGARSAVGGNDRDVDVLVGWALLAQEQVVPLPTRVTCTRRGLPIADPKGAACPGSPSGLPVHRSDGSCFLNEPARHVRARTLTELARTVRPAAA